MKKIVLFFVLIITSSCSNNNETGQKNIGDKYQGGKIAYVFKQGDVTILNLIEIFFFREKMIEIIQ
jgi:hypothetical protein